MRISFVPGHNPDLIVTHPMKRIDLTKFNNIDDLHELMVNFGFIVSDKEKKKEMCTNWRIQKLCIKYKDYMRNECNNTCPHVEL